MNVSRVIAVLSPSHHVGDHSKGVKIICSVKRQSIASGNPLLRLDLLRDRSEFFWNEVVVHRQTLVNRASNMHRALAGCNKNDGYEVKKGCHSERSEESHKQRLRLFVTSLSPLGMTCRRFFASSAQCYRLSERWLLAIEETRA